MAWNHVSFTNDLFSSSVYRSPYLNRIVLLQCHMSNTILTDYKREAYIGTYCLFTNYVIIIVFSLFSSSKCMDSRSSIYDVETGPVRPHRSYLIFTTIFILFITTTIIILFFILYILTLDLYYYCTYLILFLFLSCYLVTYLLALFAV